MTDQELITKFVDHLIKTGKEKYDDKSYDGDYEYAVGNLEAMLDTVLYKLKIGMDSSEVYTQTISRMKDKIK